MESDHKCVLVTGANTGLGFALCCRLIDDFLANKSSPSTLTLVFTTRSSQKSSTTLSLLHEHLARNHEVESSRRIRLQPEMVDLTRLLSIQVLAKGLLDAPNIPQLDAIVLNAGIAGDARIDWPLAVWQVLTDWIQGTTWPKFKMSTVGALAQPQQRDGTSNAGSTEPPLGEVFCANVFGHYMLAHWLMPLLRACHANSPGKIIWVSSIEVGTEHFNPDDLQGLRSAKVYEHTKRLTDYLALTSREPASAKSVEAFLTPSSKVLPKISRSNITPPKTYVTHPGVCSTSIVTLNAFASVNWAMAAQITRLVGSPWHCNASYIGANSASWLALASQDEIKSKEDANGVGGNAKWGSAVSRLGTGSVQRTEVDGWGINGSSEKFAWWATDLFGEWGRRRNAKFATREDLEQFAEDGAKVWSEMEKLRLDWESRIESFEKSKSL